MRSKSARGQKYARSDLLKHHSVEAAIDTQPPNFFQRLASLEHPIEIRPVAMLGPIAPVEASTIPSTIDPHPMIFAILPAIGALRNAATHFLTSFRSLFSSFVAPFINS